MIKLAHLQDLMHTHHFVPQAIVGESVFSLAKRVGFELEKGEDDLDNYCGAAAILNERVPFAVIHYQGHPEDTSTIYLPLKITNVEEITKLIFEIVGELKLEQKSLLWQRKDDPDL